MKALIVGLILCVSQLFGCVASHTLKDSISSAVTIMSNNPVTILSPNDINGTMGSGVLVTTKAGTFVWTAAHVVQNNITGNQLIFFRTEGLIRDNMDIKLGTVVAFSIEHDLAVIKIEKPFIASTSTKFFNDSHRPDAGTKVFVIGSPHGLAGASMLSTGVISRYFKLDGLKANLDAQINNGSSGGGVYLEDGRCIGLVVRIWADKYPVIVTYEEIRSWAKENNIEYALE